MRVYLNSITGIDDAIVSMYMSKRSWTREKELHIRDVVSKSTDRYGTPISVDNNIADEFEKVFNKVLKWGTKHFTMLRFIDLSVTVEGLHRGATDDFDSHAKRMDNRIIRSSTRLATYSTEEISEWYQDKIIPTDVALAHIGFIAPAEIKYNDKKYVHTDNGYILEEFKDNKDVKRGLYMLSLPMNFIFKINITEFAHVVKERDINSNANPELKNMIEDLLNQIEEKLPVVNRELFYKILN